LLAIAVFGVLLVNTFDARARRALDRMGLPSTERAAVDRELSKMAGADVNAAVRPVIDEAFVSAFRVVMIAAASLALAAAVVGSLEDRSRTARGHRP
jgi:hypothetical protein